MAEPPTEPPLVPMDVSLGEPGTLPEEPRSRRRELLITLGQGAAAVFVVLAIAMAIVIATLPPISER